KTGQKKKFFTVFLASDEFALNQVLRTNGRLVSSSFNPQKSLLQIALSFSTNSVETFIIDLATQSSTVDSTIELAGHRSDIREIKLSSDYSLIATTSSSMFLF